MKLGLRTFQIRPTAGLRADVARQLEPLQELLPITAAQVLLCKYRDRNPPFCATVHLKLRGADLHAFAHDHTLAAALVQVERTLREQISLQCVRRHRERKNRRKRRPVPRRRG